MPTNTFAVAGVTGHTGSVVARTLMDAGADVRVIVRSSQKGEPWKARGAAVAVADLGDANGLAEALRGVDGAYLLNPPSMEAGDFLAESRARTDAMAKAITTSGVPHVVFLSSVGAQHESGTGPIRTTHYAEKTLGSLDVATTFVRAAYFIENWGAVLGAVQNDGVLPTMWTEPAIAQVATVDIGKTAAQALLDGPKGKAHVIELAGPEEAAPAAVASVLSDLMGREIQLAPVPPEAQEEALKGIGASANIAALYKEMFEGIRSGTVAWEGGRAEFVRGTSTIRDVLAEMLSA